jgi:diguanylate cyclase (GGDEF)-like protein
VLAAYRERIMYWFAIIVIASITPFGINNLIHHQYELTVAIAALVVALAVDAIAVHLKKSPPIPYPLLLIPVAGSIALSLSHQGLYGVLWCYPSILFCYFVLNWRMAVACSVGMLAVFTGMVYHFVSPDVAIRFFVSLGMTILAINIIAHIINDLQRQLLDQVVTDPLTGAYNRRHMNLVLAEAIERRRRSGAAASLLVIDIDHFKQINDTYGHAVGDRVLKELVALISEKSRRLDRLFRMGGEEFLLFLPDTRIADAVVRAENLRQLIANAPLLAKRPVTASIGVSELADDLAPDTWIKRADDALYAAKQNGRNRVICAPPQTPVAAAASSASVSLPS